MGDGIGCLPGMRAVEASMPGKSTLTADAAEQAALRAFEIGGARRSGPGAGDPADAGGAEGRGDRRSSGGAHQHGAELAGVLCTWRGGGAAAAPAARTAGQDRAACRGDRGGNPERRHAPRWRVDAAAPVRRDRPARWAGDLAAVAVAPIAPKGFTWRRPRHTLKGRQDAAAVAASRRHLTDLKTRAADAAKRNSGEPSLHPDPGISEPTPVTCSANRLP